MTLKVNVPLFQDCESTIGMCRGAKCECGDMVARNRSVRGLGHTSISLRWRHRHWTLHIEHCTLHIAHCELHTVNCALHIAHCRYERRGTCKLKESVVLASPTSTDGEDILVFQ